MKMNSEQQTHYELPPHVHHDHAHLHDHAHPRAHAHHHDHHPDLFLSLIHI